MVTAKKTPYALTMAAFVAATVAILAATAVHAQQIELKPGAVAGKKIYLSHARNYAYCEIAPVIGEKEKPNLVAQFYNTSGTTGPNGGCPPAKFAAINPKKLMKAVGALAVYMNPTPQTARRHWVMDKLWIFTAGETVNFYGVDATWVAAMKPEQMKTGLAKGGDYSTKEIRRRTRWFYAKGRLIFLIRAPHGITWVMQSYSTVKDKRLAYDQLPYLRSKLKLPAGWKFAVRRPNRNLTIDTRRSGDIAHIMRDNLWNMYEACGYDAACNFTP